MTRLTKMIDFTNRLFDGKVRGDGTPYIIHCIRVMKKFDNESDRIVAVGHDNKEDFPECWDEMVAYVGLTEEEKRALILLARNEGHTYLEFIDRIIQSGCSQAIRVKRQDIYDNMTDMKGLRANPELITKRLTRYTRAYALLEGK